MKIEALIRILQYCEDNNIDIDYGTKKHITLGKRCLVRCINSPNEDFTRDRLYIGTIDGSNIEIEEDNEGDPQYKHVSNFKIIKEI